MSAIADTVFSEYEVRQMNVIFADKQIGTIKCIGSLEEEAEVKTVVKKCRGTVAKTRTRGTGSGTLKVTMHIPFALYNKMLNMDQSGLAKGVMAYGKNSLHPTFTITADVYDEDDVRKLKAYPMCTMSTGPARKVENGADEVAEVEAEIAFNPDEHGNGIYEALATELEPALAQKWMDQFTPADAQASDA